MKTKLIAAVCALAIGVCTVNADSTYDSYSGDKTADAIADVVVARPLCFAATLIGSALFVVSLPVAATSGSIDKSADILVGKPGRATFKRPIGDLKSLGK